jgi:hypothetical protein
LGHSTAALDARLRCLPWRPDRFLAHLDDKQIKILEEAFAPLEKKAGDYIIKQGEHGREVRRWARKGVDVEAGMGLTGPGVLLSSRRRLRRQLVRARQREC